MCISTILTINLGVPYVATVVGAFRDVNMLTCINGEVEYHRTIGTVDVGEGLGVGAALGVGLIVPSITVASHFRKLVGRGVVDGQVQSINLCTPVVVWVTVKVVARSGVGFIVTIRPGVGVVGGNAL